MDRISPKEFSERFNDHVYSWNRITGEFLKSKSVSYEDDISYHNALLTELMKMNVLMAKYIIQESSAAGTEELGSWVAKVNKVGGKKNA